MQPRAEPAGAALAALFADALAGGVHPAGCGCGGGVAPMIDAASLEADLLDYLGPLYEKSGETRLAGFIAARAATAGRGFAEWLRGLDAAPLDPEDRARVCADLLRVLAPIARPARPRLFCI